MIYIIALLVFILAFLLLNKAVAWLTSRERKIQKRAKSVLSSPVLQDNPENRAGYAKRDKRLQADSRLVASLEENKFLGDISDRLNRAGVPLKSGEYLALTAAAALVFFALGIFIFHHFWLALVFGLLGLLIPGLWVKSLHRQRIAKIEYQLLDAVVMMASSLRAGHSFMQALELVSHETPPPLAAEFVRVLRDNRVGMPLEEALQNMVDRVDSSEVELMVSGVLIQRQVGGNLTEILDQIAGTLEKRIKMRARIRVLTAQGRISTWVIALVPFVLGIIVFTNDPKMLSIMLSETAGIIMLVLGVVMWIAGIFAVRKVVDIDV